MLFFYFFFHLKAISGPQEERKALSFPTASWTSVNKCHSPGDCYLIYKATLLSKIRLRRGSEGARLSLQRPADCASTPQRQLRRSSPKRSDSLINISQTGQSKVLSPRLLTSKFCSIFTAYSRYHIHFMHYSILEIHVLYLFLPLKELKNHLSSQAETLYPVLTDKGSGYDHLKPMEL